MSFDQDLEDLRFRDEKDEGRTVGGWIPGLFDDDVGSAIHHEGFSVPRT